MTATIRYGKGQVALYRTYARPLSGVRPIPESPFTRRENTLFALEVDVEVFGASFLAAYTEGDNANVVATDSMKNIVLTQALAFDGATLEGFLYFLGARFLADYPQMEALRLSGRERRFRAARVPEAGVPEGGGQGVFVASDLVFRREAGARASAMVEVTRDRGGVRVVDHRCGCTGMEVVKLRGSSFAGFVRDASTTLPESAERALVIGLDVYWRYAGAEAFVGVVGKDGAGYVAAEQVEDVVHAVTHGFASKSIQHLVHEIGTRLLARFPQLAEVAFDARNLLWDTFAVSDEDPRRKVYSDPRPPYGMIHLTLARTEGT
jgi:urate oxidase